MKSCQGRKIRLRVNWNFGGALDFKIALVMDTKNRTDKKHCTTFDYETEMEKALSTIFRNLRGIEENRFRITSNQCHPGEITIITQSTSEPTAYIDLPSQKPDHELQEEVHTEQVTNVKSRRRLPEVPTGKKLTFTE